MKVEIFIPCFIDQFYPQTGMNMVKVLEKLGCEALYNPNQTCCGQPAYNAGYLKEARKVAEKYIRDFAESEHFIVVPSASCVGMIRNHYELLFRHQFQKECYQLEKNVLEFTEFITEVLEKDRVEGAKLDGIATYHDSCAALRECTIAQAPRTLIQHIEGLTLVEMKNKEICCGFGGTFSIKHSAISVAMAEQKIDNATNTQADYIISTDISCLMHLESYILKNRKKLQILHIADALASGW